MGFLDDIKNELVRRANLSKARLPGKFPAAQNPLKFAQSGDAFVPGPSALTSFADKQNYVHKWTVPFDTSGVTEALLDSASNGMLAGGKRKRTLT